MKIDRPASLKFRNQHGEVYASLIFFEEGSSAMRAGFSCCNPKDMNTTPRKEKVFKHRQASLGRVLKKPLVIPLPEPLDAVPPEKRYGVVRKALVEFISEFEKHNMGFRPYRGDACKSEFRQWMSKFVESLNAPEEKFSATG
jgi:hypothetical protein